MKKLAGLLILIMIVSVTAIAQTKTTQQLDEKYAGLSLYFYKNTLKMLNQKDDKNFDEIVKDVEKMRFIMIDRTTQSFSDSEYNKLKKDYQGESYEEVMSSRIDGRNFTVYVKETGGSVKGTIIVASDSSQIFVLDILGKVALDKVPAFFNSLGEDAEIGGKIKDFMNMKID